MRREVPAGCRLPPAVPRPCRARSRAGCGQWASSQWGFQPELLCCAASWSQLRCSLPTCSCSQLSRENSQTSLVPLSALLFVFRSPLAFAACSPRSVQIQSPWCGPTLYPQVELPLIPFLFSSSFFLSLLFTSFRLPVGYCSWPAPVLAVVSLSMDLSSNPCLKVIFFDVHFSCISPILSFHLNYSLLCHLYPHKWAVDFP